MSEIISVQHGQLCTTSRIVAEKFGKQHGHVIRTIKSLEIEPEIHGSNFGLISYTDELNRQKPEYLITRDGFTLLVMGFTGKEAMKFKIEFIKAFNEMEERLKAQVKPLTPAEALLQSVQMLVDQEKRLSQVEATLQGIIKTKEVATEQLLLVERSSAAMPEESTRDKIRRIVNKYVHAKNVEYKVIWNLIYDRLYYRYHVNLRAVNKYRDETGLDVAERLGHLDKIYTIVSAELLV